MYLCSCVFVYVCVCIFICVCVCISVITMRIMRVGREAEMNKQGRTLADVCHATAWVRQPCDLLGILICISAFSVPCNTPCDPCGRSSVACDQHHCTTAHDEELIYCLVTVNHTVTCDVCSVTLPLLHFLHHHLSWLLSSLTIG